MCCLARWISWLPELWGPPSWAVPGKLLGTVGHRKHNCLQDQDRSHRSRAWLVSFILDTGFKGIYYCFFFLRTQDSGLCTFEAYISLPRETHDSGYCLNGLPSTQQFLFIWNQLLLLHTLQLFIAIYTWRTCVLIDMFWICMSQPWLHTNDYLNAVRLGDAYWYLWPDYFS